MTRIVATIFIILLYLQSSNIIASDKSPRKMASIPVGYYDNAVGKSGLELKTALHNIIKNHTKFPYTSAQTDVWDILKDTDEDTLNAANVILLYTGRSQDKDLNGSLGPDPDYWNREHVWAKSHGFPAESDTAYTDVHHLRPCDASVNSSRNNKDFDNGGTPHIEATECSSDADSWEPRDAVKGDVARMMFYMAVRYESDGNYDLELVETIPSSGPQFAKLATLLAWHYEDPVDNWERIRNDKIYSYQGNRNPFIDHPEYVDQIWVDIKEEPTNHPTNFIAAAIGQSISLTWNDASGAITPDKYLIKVSDSGYDSLIDPTDGIQEIDDINFDDGLGVLNISNGIQSATFGSLQPHINYYFKIYSYTNNGINADYKTDGIIKTTEDITGEQSNSSELFISEYIEGSSGSNKYLEIINNKGISVDLSSYDIQVYYNGNVSPGSTIPLSGSLANYDVFVIAHSSANAWGGLPDQTSGGLSFNGNDAVVLRKNGANIDIIGQIGDDLNLYANKTLRRSQNIFEPNSTYTASEWDDIAETFDGLGVHTLDESLPVDLISFSALYQDGAINLFWATASEMNNLGFIIERSVDNSLFEQIATYENLDELKGAGNTSNISNYAHTDYSILENQQYTYRLWNVEYEGTRSLKAQLVITTQNPLTTDTNMTLPETTRLIQNYPNPFNPSTQIQLQLNHGQNVKLIIHNINGQLVDVLFKGFLDKGSHMFAWDPSTKQGEKISAGIYIYTLVSDELVISKRMLYLK